MCAVMIGITKNTEPVTSSAPAKRPSGEVGN